MEQFKAGTESDFSVWFLGQNAFVLRENGGPLIAIDPYLSDWCATRGKSKEKTSRSRLFDPFLSPKELNPDIVLITHSHCDHADPETLSALASDTKTCIIAPWDSLQVAKEAGFSSDRLHLIHAGQELSLNTSGVAASQKSPRIKATFALPTDGTDLNHVGFFIRFSSGASFWNTGDSAWYENLGQLCLGSGLFSLGERSPDLMAVCINTGYGNLSHWDASKLAGELKPRFVIPTHWDLFPHNSCDPEPFRTSLSKNAVGSQYAFMEKNLRYDFAKGLFKKA